MWILLDKIVYHEDTECCKFLLKRTLCLGISRKQRAEKCYLAEYRQRNGCGFPLEV